MDKKGHNPRNNTKPSSDQKTYAFKGRGWIEGEEGTFLGFGRVTLLERIVQYGSISEAARSMNMSYRHAWDLIDSMNRQSQYPLVESTAGGKKGGGTQVTEAGMRAIELFWGFYGELDAFLETCSRRYSFDNDKGGIQ